MRSFFTIVLATLLGFQNVLSLSNPVWEELTAMPEGRSGMVAIITEQSEPAYYGGTSWDENEKLIHSTGYALRNDKWHLLDSLKKPIAYAAVAGENGLLYAAGGTDGIGLHSSLLTLGPSLLNSEIEIIASQARIYAGAALIDGAFYQVGGSTNLSPLIPSTNISKFEHGSWRDVGQLPEGPLINPAVATWKNSILVAGGGIPKVDGLKNTDSVFSFDTAKRTWTKLADLPAPTRGAIAHSVPGVGILVIGGYLGENGFTSQVLLFDPQKNEFISLTNLPVGLLLPAVVAAENWIYVFGGEDEARHRSRSVYRASLKNLMQSRSE